MIYDPVRGLTDAAEYWDGSDGEGCVAELERLRGIERRAREQLDRIISHPEVESRLAKILGIDRG